jgi:hypothetical protein
MIKISMNYNKIARWYNFFIFNEDNLCCLNNDIFIKNIISNLDYICNNSSHIITHELIYNSLDMYNRNILHYLYIYNLTNTYLYDYIISNKYADDFYFDIYGKKPSDYLQLT